jgi:hypothetical protein
MGRLRKVTARFAHGSSNHRAAGILSASINLQTQAIPGTELRHQLFKINVELDWFEKYVNDR